MAALAARKKHKHLILDQAMIDQAQRLLGTRTEKETIERALKEVIEERERNRQARAAHERLVKSGIEVRDVYCVLNETD